MHYILVISCFRPLLLKLLKIQIGSANFASQQGYENKTMVYLKLTCSLRQICKNVTLIYFILYLLVGARCRTRTKEWQFDSATKKCLNQTASHIDKCKYIISYCGRENPYCSPTRCKIPFLERIIWCWTCKFHHF